LKFVLRNFPQLVRVLTSRPKLRKNFSGVKGYVLFSGITTLRLILFRPFFEKCTGIGRSDDSCKFRLAFYTYVYYSNTYVR